MKTFAILSVALAAGASTAFAAVVPLEERQQQGAFLQKMGVAYRSSAGQEPSNSVREINGKSSDINYKFGGGYVYLTKTYTDDPGNGLTDFWFHHWKTAHACDDLAKGAGGDFRCIEQCNLYNRGAWAGSNPEQTCPENHPIATDAGLYRLDNSRGPVDVPPRGWKWISADLNGGRKGDYLYIVTK